MKRRHILSVKLISKKTISKFPVFKLIFLFCWSFTAFEMVQGTYTSLEVGDGFLDRLLSYKQERSTTLPDSLSEGNLLAQILQRKRRNSSVNQRPKGRLNGLFPRDDWSLGEDLPTVHPHNQINEYNQGLLQPEEDVSDSERLRDFIPSLNNEFDRGFGSGDERNLTASLAGVRHPYEGGVPEPRTNETDFHRNFRFLWQEVFPIEGSGFPGRGTFRVFRTPEQLSTTSEISSTANDLYPTRTSTASSETPPTTVVAMSVTTQQSNGNASASTAIMTIFKTTSTSHSLLSYSTTYLVAAIIVPIMICLLVVLMIWIYAVKRRCMKKSRVDPIKVRSSTVSMEMTSKGESSSFSGSHTQSPRLSLNENYPGLAWVSTTNQNTLETPS